MNACGGFQSVGQQERCLAGHHRNLSQRLYHVFTFLDADTILKLTTCIAVAGRHLVASRCFADVLLNAFSPLADATVNVESSIGRLRLQPEPKEPHVLRWQLVISMAFCCPLWSCIGRSCAQCSVRRMEVLMVFWKIPCRTTEHLVVSLCLRASVAEQDLVVKAQHELLACD